MAGPPNPFDVFDAPAPQQANPFDAFDDPELTPEQEDAVSLWDRRLRSNEDMPGIVHPARHGRREEVPDAVRRHEAIEAAKSVKFGTPAARISPLEAGLTGFSQMNSFNLADEGDAGLSALASFVKHLPQGWTAAKAAAGKVYGERMDMHQWLDKTSQEDQPAAYYAGGLGPGVVSIPLALKGAAGKAAAPAANAAKSFWTKLMGGLAKTGKAGVTGAAMGETAAVGSQRGDIGARVKNAGWEAPVYGAGAGAMMEPVANLAGKAVRGVVDAVAPMTMDADSRATFLLQRAMKRDGLDMGDLAQAQRKVKAMGGDTLETLAELASYTGKSAGRNMRGLARALASVPGKGADIAEKLVAMRRDAIHSGASKAVAAATGKNVTNYADDLAQLEEQLRQSHDEAYDAFRKTPVDPGVFRTRISHILNTPPGRAAMASARDQLEVQEGIARAAGDDKLAEALKTSHRAISRFAETPGDGPISGQARAGANTVLPARALDAIKQDMDDQALKLDRDGHPNAAAVLRRAKNNFAENVSLATNGAYGEALGRFFGGKRLREAIDVGVKAVHMKPWQLDQAISGTGLHNAMTQEEFEGLTLGFARGLQDLIDNNDVSAVRGVLRNKGMQGKLKEIMGDRYNGFVSRITRMVNRQDFDNFLTKGSPTARIQSEIADANEEDFVTRATDSLANQSASGGAPSVRAAVAAATLKPLLKGVGETWSKARYRGVGNDKVNAALSEKLLTPMKDKAFGAVQASAAAKPLKPTNLPGIAGDLAAYYASQDAGRKAVGMGAPARRADEVVEGFERPLVEEYLKAETTPQRRKEIEAMFGADAPSLWMLRAKAAGAAPGGATLQ